MTTPLEAQVAPIAVKVTRYLCAYCNRGRSTKSACAKHMERCFKNPALHGCKTCAFFKTPPTRKVGTPQSPASCKAGFNLRPGLVTQCRKWAPISAPALQ